MRYGIFGDIHGNYDALEAVLESLEKDNVDVLICLGDVKQVGTAQIYGAFVHGPKAAQIWTRGTFDVRYSSEALSLANQFAGLYVSFNGWQELSR